MKKALLLTLALVFAMGVSVSAQDVSVNLEAGYLFGTFENDVASADHQGIVLCADAVISGPFGAMLNYSSLESSNFEYELSKLDLDNREQTTSRFDILATYTLPVDAVKAKVALGYTSTTMNETEDYLAPGVHLLASPPESWERETTISGAMVGVAGEFAPADKFTVTGFAGFGVGLDVERDTTAIIIVPTVATPVPLEDEECNLTVLKVAAAYQIVENLAIEAGYEYNKYEFDPDEYEFTIDGFFLGARASF